MVATLAFVIGGAMQSGAASDNSEVIDAAIRGVNAAQNAASVRPDSAPLKEINVKLASPGSYAQYLELPRGFADRMSDTAATLPDVLAGDELTAASGIVRAERERLASVDNRLRSLPADGTGTETVDYLWSSGADQFEFSTVDVEDTTAVLKGTTRLWSSGVAVGNGWLSIFSPAEPYVVEVRLIRDGTTWKVSQIGLDKAVPADNDT